MQIACVCYADETVSAVLCIHHIFYCGLVHIPTKMYYSADTNVVEAKEDCHKIALAAANMILQRYNMELSE